MQRKHKGSLIVSLVILKSEKMEAKTDQIVPIFFRLNSLHLYNENFI